MEWGQCPRAQTDQRHHSERPCPLGCLIKYVGPRSLRCDLTWPGAFRVREGWPSLEGSERKEAAAGSSEGAPESVRAAA